MHNHVIKYEMTETVIPRVLSSYLNIYTLTSIEVYFIKLKNILRELYQIKGLQTLFLPTLYL